ncbi:MAG: hypothetical protein HYX27_14820 [Acidobacteria bacterium]|nr:hypothetical protein [Acidobacteriota bacterium]
MKRPSPEELLRRVQAEERAHKRGKLKVFLGYAPGVGKSARMLDEGRRRKKRGQDVVVGAVQPGGDDLVKDFEVIPMRAGCVDVEAVKRRRPGVCLIDGLAFRNVEGSKNEERWQDVEDLLAAGISVITTINLQYIREKQAQVEAIRGKRVLNSVPESFLKTADDIEIVDAPPEQGGLLERQLSELREIALVLAAEVVDAELGGYGTQERILVCVTPRSNAELMIGRGRRQAERFHGNLFVAYFEQAGLPARDEEMLAHNLQAAREANAEVVKLQGEDFVIAVLKFCEEHGITQIFLGHSQRRGFWQRFVANPVERLIAESSGMDVRVFPSRDSVA